MAKLDVSATIHPIDVDLLLVAVQNEAGDPVRLGEDSFSVFLWASGTGPPSAVSPGGNVAIAVPVNNVKALDLPDAGFFYELELGKVSFAVGHSVWVVSPTLLEPIVYTVTIRTRSDHGQAIACACHPPLGKAER